MGLPDHMPSAHASHYHQINEQPTAGRYKRIERNQVPFSDALTGPWAVVVQSFNTDIAVPAVLDVQPFHQSTVPAVIFPIDHSKTNLPLLRITYLIGRSLPTKSSQPRVH